MDAVERAAWLRLALTPGLNARDTRALLAEFGLPGALFDPQPTSTRQPLPAGRLPAALCGEPPPEVATALARTLAWLAAGANRHLITLADPDYPPGLLNLADAPPLLYALGRRDCLARPALAIVGSRNATQQGALNAEAFAEHLGHAGLCIVSGMASGIDAAAHRGALRAESGTIAVLGTGIDRVYPPANRALAIRIAGAGLLLSEYPVGTPARGHHFPRRNRLIAALARGVLVVEAALHSGSLITARLAVELGRDVFAVPGSIHSPLARGCHRLIRDGAKLVESVQDILEELPGAGLRGTAPINPVYAAPGDGGATLLAAMGHDPVDLDTLATRTGADAGRLIGALLELELARRVERLPGNRYQRID